MPRLAPVTSATWPASSSLNLLILSDNPFGQQRKLILQRMLVEIGQRGRIGAREAVVAILRHIVVALRSAERAVAAVHGRESQAVGLGRAEGRRVGQGVVSTCRSGWPPQH